MADRQRRVRLPALGLAALVAIGVLGLGVAPAVAQGAPGANMGAQLPDVWPARVGRIAEIQGTVWFFDRDEGAWTQAMANRPLTSGDRISTDRGSRVVLRIGSTALRLAGNSDLTLDRLDDQRMVVELSDGSVAARITASDVLSQVEIVTQEGRFLPRSVGHFRIDRRADSSEGTAWRGQLQFDGPDSQLPIGAGQHAEFWLQGSPVATHYRMLPLERDDFAEWVARDDRDPDRQLASRYVSTEMTGWEELDRYGRWSSHPEFGNVWVPSDVPAGWAPYQDGRWVWVSPWGWTWMDAAPWGFAPFHYGRWVRWGGRWVWTPGARGARPAYAPALVTWAHVPHRDSNRRPPPPVGWAPLNPRDVYRPPYTPVVPHVRDRVPPPPRGDRHPTPRVDHQPAPRVERQPDPRGDRQPTPRVDRQPAPRVDRTPAPRDDHRPARPPNVVPVVPPTAPMPVARPPAPQPAQPAVQPPVRPVPPPGPRTEGPRPEGPRSDGPRTEVPRTDNPNRDRGRQPGSPPPIKPDDEGRKRPPEQPGHSRDRQAER